MDKRDRLWELKNLGDIIENEDETASQRNHEDGDYEMFLQELEADKDMRANINLYKKQLTKSGKDSKMDVSKAEGEPIDTLDKLFLSCLFSFRR